MEALKELYCSEIKYNCLNNMKRMQLYNLKRNWSIKKRILNAILKLSGIQSIQCLSPAKITYVNGKEGKAKWRYLTSRECFMLMGFDEEDYERAISINPEYIKGKKLLTNEKMIKMAGNSICVDVLVALFKQIIEIDEMLFEE